MGVPPCVVPKSKPPPLAYLSVPAIISPITSRNRQTLIPGAVTSLNALYFLEADRKRPSGRTGVIASVMKKCDGTAVTLHVTILACVH